MIGIQVDPEVSEAAGEFFELFKTPWEHADAEKEYPVVIVSGEESRLRGTRLTIVYRSKRLSSEAVTECASYIEYEEETIPLYRSSRDSDDTHPRRWMTIDDSGDARVVTIGYDLFRETDFLLTAGQPIELAHIPTLDLHIDILKKTLNNSGIEFEELEPAPNGCPYTICLSHDVDHPRIGFHGLDHTVMGFLYRATFGSGIRALQGKLAFKHALRNLGSAAAFPFVKLGLLKDTWDSFDEYGKLEKGHPSTYFAIPFKGVPGESPRGSENFKRASAYGAEDIKEDLAKLRENGNEVAVHGLDAWRDSAEGERERREIEKHASRKTSESGVRMHWLYFERESHKTLEEAGYTYDSSIGFNETVGYRAGTNRVFRPLGVNRLLEIPLIIMDTSLFYPSHLNLSASEARNRVAPIFERARQHGGVITVNWHDRSLAPERNWGELFEWMVNKGEEDGAWFASMGEAAQWFRERRNTQFTTKQEQVSPA